MSLPQFHSQSFMHLGDANGYIGDTQREQPATNLRDDLKQVKAKHLEANLKKSLEQTSTQLYSDGVGLNEVEMYDLKVYAPTSLLLERQNRLNGVQKK